MARDMPDDDLVWEQEHRGQEQSDTHEITDKAAGSCVPRVLLVGYDERVTTALHAALGEDCAISQAANAEEAANALGHHRADVLLMDYQASNSPDPRFAESASRSGIPVLWMHADPLGVQVLGDIVKALVRTTRRS
jgi:hypothetical protein